jgi:hypothetical protein
MGIVFDVGRPKIAVELYTDGTKNRGDTRKGILILVQALSCLTCGNKRITILVHA